MLASDNENRAAREPRPLISLKHASKGNLHLPISPFWPHHILLRNEFWIYYKYLTKWHFSILVSSGVFSFFLQSRTFFIGGRKKNMSEYISYILFHSKILYFKIQSHNLMKIQYHLSSEFHTEILRTMNNPLVFEVKKWGTILLYRVSANDQFCICFTTPRLNSIFMEIW